MRKVSLATLLPLITNGLALMNPKVWMDKPRATAIVAALLASALLGLKHYGYDVPYIDPDLLRDLAGVIVTCVLFGIGQREARKRRDDVPADPQARIRDVQPQNTDFDDEWQDKAAVHPADREAP